MTSSFPRKSQVTVAAEAEKSRGCGLLTKSQTANQRSGIGFVYSGIVGLEIFVVSIILVENLR